MIEVCKKCKETFSSTGESPTQEGVCVRCTGEVVVDPRVDNYAITALVTPPFGQKDQYQVAILISPFKINDLKNWKEIGKSIALGFYRAYSGDKRSDELVKEFDKL